MTTDITGWRKSSYSGTQGGNCVEVGVSQDGEHVYVRNTRDRAGAILDFTRAEWGAFLADVRNGKFERSAPAQ